MRRARTVTVDALAYVTGKHVGVMHKARLTVSPNPDREPNVAIAGDLSAGLGGSWRAGVWMAAYQACNAVGRELTDYAIQARAYGLIDGASASALFTAAMMAAMMGTPVREEFTMTGTVNPDGTVGPVGGIPNKFRAAIRGGKRLLGYPVGQRFARDYRTKKLVDLKQLAAQNGARAVEVATVYDAYGLLTGRRFPRPSPLPPSEMDLPPAVFRMLQTASSKWAKIFQTYTKGFAGQRVTKARDAAKRISVAIRYMKKSTELLREGSVAAAYDFSQRGGAWAFTSFWYARFYRLALQRNFKEIFKTTVKLREVEKKIAGKLQEMRSKRPRTMGQLMSLVAAFEQLVEAWVYSQHGKSLLEGTVSKIKQMSKSPPRANPAALMFGWFYRTAFRFALADVKQAKAGNFLRLHQSLDVPYRLDPVRLRQVAKIFMAAAQANLVYFEQMFVPQFVKALGKSPSIVKNLLMEKIGKYLLATVCLRFPQFVLARAWGKTAVETAFAQMAGGMGSYFNSSMLITKYYSLKLSIVKKLTGSGSSVQSVPRLKALVAMLEHAEESARINAGLAKRYAGAVPAAALVFYRIGLTMKEMMPALKIKALEMFWRASMECQLAVMLSRRS
jgi:predicted S18 family serine protease